MDDRRPPPKFCPQCGAALPPDAARFCIACGRPVRGRAPAEDEGPAAALGPTVRLANAAVPQQAIGGTVKLPASGAVPPGLWVLDEPPGPADVVAIYPPLRPVRGGWSGLVGRGWRPAGSEAAGQRMVFHFVAPVEWFPAEGCGAGLRLAVEVAASSRAWEGKGRRGFRFGLRRDGPMRVVAAGWRDGAGGPVADRPLPQIQIMAPPRVPRVADLDDEPARLDAREAALWAEGSQAHGAYRLHREQLMQEHTPAGRGITLVPLREGSEGGRPWWGRLLSGMAPARYRARVERPLLCELGAWAARLRAIGAEARGLGLDLEPALAAEWWLDRNGHDGVVFTGARARYGAERVVIVFRRGQLAQIRD
ncbi:MAG TPA: zinc ribbon domain-containing protein [Chloroflexaceae bacterium]|nr:zinc ribbon domain-containing protein [Chloroflexaceae bacterium]